MRTLDWLYLYFIVLSMCSVAYSLAYDDSYELLGTVFLAFLIISGEHMNDKKRYIYYKYVLGRKVALAIDLIWVGIGIYVLVFWAIIPWYNIVNNLF